MRHATALVILLGLVLALPAAGQIGTVLKKFPSPDDVYGLTVVGDSVWGATFLDTPPILYEFDKKTGAVLSSLTHAYTYPFGLGWDSRRMQFVLTSASHGTVVRVDRTGQVTASLKVPTSASVGVAYDWARDGYWVTDWSAKLLYLMDAVSGATLQPPFDLKGPGATRASDVGFSSENDIVVVVDRDTEAAFLFDAGSPPTLRNIVSLKAAAIPLGAKGAAIDPRRQTLYTDQTSTPYTVLEIDIGLPRVEASDTVAVGKTLAIAWTATASPGRVYQAGASLAEGMGFVLGSRYLPIRLDQLFWLSLANPVLFSKFSGVLDPGGTAAGGVTIPAVPMLAGIDFYLAFVTVWPAAPSGIEAFSGAWKVSITK
ncbi:MAG: hypothetical protein JXQ29_03405 [Planctomycetes bacterium]|nr:hypothetical protein [Planctomycetota bacterium]